MSGFKGIAKGGWHPKGKAEGGKEGWRSDFKGVNTVAGWMGKGKDPNAAERENHVSAPLSSLKDPSSFGPPPKHINYHGAAAVPDRTTPDTSGLGAPVSQDHGSAKQRLQARREAEARAEEEANRPPPGPYKADTTGLNTAHLPKPPVRRDASSPTVGGPAKPPPKLPPRLPPRQNSHPDAYAPEPPPSYTETTRYNGSDAGTLNQGALSRLSQAGVSVPGFNIGRNASPPVPPRQTPSPAQAPAAPPASASRNPQLGELQSRFSKLKTSSSGEETSTGTSVADKQAALRTASNLRNDPSNVSLSDMRSAASTANNFRERHGDQVASGWQKANGLNQKYGIADRVNSYAGDSAVSATPPPQPSTAANVAGKKPPPPPPKRKGLSAGEPASPQTGDAPPPIPLGSKPKW